MSITRIINESIDIQFFNNFKNVSNNLKFIVITDDKLFDKLKNFEDKLIAQELLKYFKTNEIDYPYFRMMKPNVHTIFKNIKNIKSYFTYEKYELGDQKDALFVLPLEFNLNSTKKYYLYDYDASIYDHTDILADYFIEHSRLQCKRGQQNKNALDIWYDYDSTLFKTLLNIVTKYKNLKITEIKKQFQRLTQECSGEKSTFYVSLFKLLYNDPTKIKILDAAAGYGNRLLGAMAANVQEYVGIEPNTMSHDGFKEMISTFKKYCNKENRYQVLLGGLPDIKLNEKYDKNYFDICIISPPSYNSEIYSQDSEQSIVKYNDEESWTIEFLYKTLDKIWKTIKKEGYLIVQSILNKVINPYIYTNLPNANYAGCIAVRTMAGRNKPMWIWKKTSKQIFELPDKNTVYQEVKYNSLLRIPYFKRLRLVFITEPKGIYYVETIPNVKELINKYQFRVSVKTVNDDLGKYDWIILYSCWNYYDYVDLFTEKINKYSNKLINPYKTIKWNMNKKYLFDLENEGVPIIPTKLCNIKQIDLIKEYLKEWKKIVIKPLIGADSHKVFIIDNYEDVKRVTLANFTDEFLVQKYMKEIENECYYLILFDYKYSHHVVMELIDKNKTMTENNRIVINKGCPQKFINYCENVIGKIKNMGYESVYARIDGVNVNGEFVIMEIELIEPNLHFNVAVDSSKKYFESINKYIS